MANYCRHVRTVPIVGRETKKGKRNRKKNNYQMLCFLGKPCLVLCWYCDWCTEECEKQSMHFSYDSWIVVNDVRSPAELSLLALFIGICIVDMSFRFVILANKRFESKIGLLESVSPNIFKFLLFVGVFVALTRGLRFGHSCLVWSVDLSIASGFTIASAAACTNILYHIY